MNIDEIYEVIKPLKHKKFKWPELTEKNHELFWKTACSLGIRQDERYPRKYHPESVLREKEFKGKAMYQQGNRQSLTYRTNRVEQNLYTIINWFARQCSTRWVWGVRDNGSWSTLGYIIASSKPEADQLASMMYAGLSAEGKVSAESHAHVPIFFDDTGIFVTMMNNLILGIKDRQEDRRKRIAGLNNEIDTLELKSDFLLLNMTAFDSGT